MLAKRSEAQCEQLKLEAFRRRFRDLERCLDTAETGPLWLKDTRIAGLVADSIHYRAGGVYRLDAFCVMANHVHLVFAPLPVAPASEDYYSLARILHSLKRHTARAANLLLNRHGEFWQHESFDHYVRHSDEHQRIVGYVLNNPVKAGLVSSWQDWSHSFCRR